MASVSDVLHRGQGEPIKVSGSRRLGPGRLVERCVLSVAGPRASLAVPPRGVLPSDPGGHVDLTSFIALLNEDLQTEFQSVVQYVQHTAAITGPEYLSTVDELKVHLGQELKHAQILAEQIAFLG